MLIKYLNPETYNSSQRQLPLPSFSKSQNGPLPRRGLGESTYTGCCTSVTPAPLAPCSIQGSPQHEAGQTRNSRLTTIPSSFLTSSPFLHSLSFTVAHEHLKERGLFGFPPPPPGASPAEYYHLMGSHRSPYGDLLMQGAGTTAGAHLSDYIAPIDGK